MQDYIEVTSAQLKLGLATVGIVVILIVVGALSWYKKTHTNPQPVAEAIATPQAADTTLLPSPAPTTPAQVQDVTGALIESFPTFPVYPGAEIKSSRKQPNATENVKGYSAEWEVSGDKNVATVATWYRTELTKQGWVVAQVDPENVSVSEQDLRASRGKQNAAIIIEKGEGTDASTIDILVDLPADAP